MRIQCEAYCLLLNKQQQRIYTQFNNPSAMPKSSTKQLRNNIIQYFQSIASGENILQCIKQAIFLHEKFNPLMLFEQVSSGKQVQTKNNWRQYLQNINVEFSQEELQYVFKHHHWGECITLNQFMEGIIPYNMDVLRIFKKNYLQAIELPYMDQEIQFMFRELISFLVKFSRSLIKIRNQISAMATRDQVQELIKQDLIYQNKNRDKVREAVKFKENFQLADFELTYNQLRRFLQLWVVDYHQNDLLQLKRFFKQRNPFQHICWREQNEKSKSPRKMRSKSTQKLTRRKEMTEVTKNKSHYKQKYAHTQDNNSKYVSFRDDLYKGFKDTNDFRELSPEVLKPKNKNKSAQVSGRKINRNLKNQYQQDEYDKKFGQIYYKKPNIDPRQQYARNLRYARDRKGIDGSYCVQILQQIVTKEEKLQKLRKKLANNNNFNLINLFKLIDINNKGYVTAKAIKEFIEQQSIDFKYLIRQFEREKGKLRFQDFCMIFRPLSKKLNQALDERPQHRVPNPFKRQTMSMIREVILQTAQMFQSLNRIKQNINNDGIHPQTLFRYLDVSEKGYIEASDIKDLLNEKNIRCEQKDLKCVMKIFKKRVNETINIRQFQNFIDL